MSDEGTLVLSDESKTRKVNISVYEAQLARLRYIASSENDVDGPLWQLMEGHFVDSVGLPRRRYAHLYRVVDSPIEAFEILAPRMLEEVAMLALSMSVRETEFGQWICCLEANEKVSK